VSESIRQEIEVVISDRQHAEAWLRRLDAALGQVGEAGGDAADGVEGAESAIEGAGNAARQSTASVRQVGEALEDAGNAAAEAGEKKKKSYFSLERIGTASMAAAGGLKFAQTMLSGTGTVAEKVNGTLDSLQMLLVGFGPWGMIAAGGISMVRTAINWLTDDADDLVASTMSVTAEMKKLHDTMLPAADGSKLAESAMNAYADATGRAVTQLSLLEELQITQAANAVGFLAAQRRKIREERLAIEQESIELRRRLSQPYDSSRALGVVTDASRLSYLDKRAKVLADLEAEATPFGPEIPAGGLPKTKAGKGGSSRGPNGSLLGPLYDQARSMSGRVGDTYAEFQSWADAQAAERARQDQLQQERYKLQSEGVQGRIDTSRQAKRDRGFGLAGVIQDEADRTDRAKELITGAMSSISSSMGQFVAASVLAGKMTAKAWKEWAAGQLFAVGADAIGKGIYLEALAGASLIFGLGLATGSIAAMGAGLIAGGLLLVGMSRALGGGGSVPGRGGGGRGAGGGGGGGGPARGLASPGASGPLIVNVVVGLSDRQIHDATARGAGALAGQRGMTTVLTSR